MQAQHLTQNLVGPLQSPQTARGMWNVTEIPAVPHSVTQRIRGTTFTALCEPKACHGNSAPHLQPSRDPASNPKHLGSIDTQCGINWRPAQLTPSHCSFLVHHSEPGRVLHSYIKQPGIFRVSDGVYWRSTQHTTNLRSLQVSLETEYDQSKDTHSNGETPCSMDRQLKPRKQLKSCIWLCKRNIGKWQNKRVKCSLKSPSHSKQV